MIDVSEYQGKPDWADVAKHGVERSYVKLGQWYPDGGYRRDPQAVNNVKGAQDHGLAVGVYWYATPSNAPHREAAAFLDLYHPLMRHGQIRPALDLEVTMGHSWEYLNDWKAQWFAVVDQELGARCFFYSYWYFWKQMRLYPDRPVWGAYVGGAFEPPESWVIRQYSFTGLVPGIHGHVDLDKPLKEIPLL